MREVRSYADAKTAHCSISTADGNRNLSQSAKVKGRIMDASGSVMPGVQIKVYQGEKVIKEGTTSGSGDFEIPVDPGEYKLEMTAPDFDTYSEVVRVTPDMGPLSVTM